MKRARAIIPLPAEWDEFISRCGSALRDMDPFAKKWTDATYIQAMLRNEMVRLSAKHPKPKPLTEWEQRQKEGQEKHEAWRKAHAEKILASDAARKRKAAEELAKAVGGEVGPDGEVSISHEQFLAMGNEQPQYKSLVGQPKEPTQAQLEKRARFEKEKAETLALVAKNRAEAEAKEKALRGGAR